MRGTIDHIAELPRGWAVTFSTYDAKAVSDLAERRQNDEKAVYDISVKRHRKIRSLNANAYLWVLCDKIAQAIRSTKQDVYLLAIREVGVYHDVCIQDKDVQAFIDKWESNGVGWCVEQFDSTVDDCKRLRAYYGSSTYNTKEMARLIDYVVTDAKELDIETETPDEIARMKQEWKHD